MRGIRLENFEAETHFIDVRHVLVDTMVNAGGNQNGLADCRLAQAETCLDCTDAAGDVVKLKNRMPVEICRGFFKMWTNCRQTARKFSNREIQTVDSLHCGAPFCILNKYTQESARNSVKMLPRRRMWVRESGSLWIATASIIGIPDIKSTRYFTKL